MHQFHKHHRFCKIACFATYATVHIKKVKATQTLIIENTWKGRTCRQQLWSRLAIHLSASVDNMIRQHDIKAPNYLSCKNMFLHWLKQVLFQYYRTVPKLNTEMFFFLIRCSEGKSRQISLHQSPFQTIGVPVKVMVTKKTRIEITLTRTLI